MWNKITFKSNILTIGVLIFTTLPLILMLYEKRKYESSKGMKKDDSYYKCIFITHENHTCVQHVYKSLPCGDLCSCTYLQTLVNMLQKANTSISMCIYHITLQDIRDALIEAKSKNVLVRIITDREMEFNSGSKVPHLRNEGIQVKTQNNNETTGFLHHKFCLIDECVPTRIMWFGSLNLTMQGLCSNWDNIVITDNKEIISNFSNAFESLWTIL